MNEKYLNTLREKYTEEFGDAGVKFMSFVIDQCMQLDLVKGAIESTIDKNEEATNSMVDAFSVIHSHLTGAMAEALSLSDEMSSRIFHSASEAYELMSHKAMTGEDKSDA